jgi:hypothetical protein
VLSVENGKIIYVLSVENEKISETLFTIDFGTNSTYEHSHMPKINSSSVKICESSRPRLAQKFSIVTRIVVHMLRVRVEEPLNFKILLWWLISNSKQKSMRLRESW